MSSKLKTVGRKKNTLILVLTVLTCALLVSSAAVFAKYDTYAGRFALEEIAEYKALPSTMSLQI